MDILEMLHNVLKKLGDDDPGVSDVHQLSEKLNDHLEHAGPFEILRMAQAIHPQDLHEMLKDHGEDIDALDALLDVHEPLIDKLSGSQTDESPLTNKEATQDDTWGVPHPYSRPVLDEQSFMKRVKMLFGKYGRCAECNCSGYQGSSVTTNNFCSRCGHHYDDHW